MKSTQMEQGHLYKAELPEYNKGQLGKGASISGSHQKNQGSSINIGNDSYAGKLKADWNKAISADTKFKR